jgi:crossover junction endodeoxyribonuclease RuvC
MPNSTWYLGIDPGLHGALALLPPDGECVACRDTPIVHVKRGTTTRAQYAPGDMRAVLVELLARATVTNGADATSAAHVVAIIELVHALPGEGVRSVGTLMRGSGLWEGMCAGLGIPVRLVAPQAWKKHAGLLRTKKGASRVVASTMFPTLDLGPKSQTGRADAVLIAAYGRANQF